MGYEIFVRFVPVSQSFPHKARLLGAGAKPGPRCVFGFGIATEPPVTPVGVGRRGRRFCRAAVPLAASGASIEPAVATAFRTGRSCGFRLSGGPRGLGLLGHWSSPAFGRHRGRYSTKRWRVLDEARKGGPGPSRVVDIRSVQAVLSGGQEQGGG